jgi:hypothetical protein
MGMSEQANSSVWYLLHNNKQHGPYPFSVLLEGANKGRLTQSDRVWRQGWQTWQEASTVPGLFIPLPATNRTNGAVERADQAHRNYFVRHWRGDLSLAVSFWINGFLVNAVLLAVALVPIIYLERNPQDANLTILALTLLFLLAWALLAIWQLVGIWRSASHHVLRGGRKFWSIAAKVVVVLAGLRMLLDVKDILAIAVGALTS